MRADKFLTYIVEEDKDLTYPAVVIREWDRSPILYVVARVEHGETSEELFKRADRVADALTVERPPKRDSVGHRAADK